MSPQRNSSSVFKIASLAFYHGFGILSLQKSPRAKLGRRERHVVRGLRVNPSWYKLSRNRCVDIRVTFTFRETSVEISDLHLRRTESPATSVIRNWSVGGMIPLMW